MSRLVPVVLLLWAMVSSARAEDNAPFRVESRHRLQQTGRIGGVAFTPDGKTVVVGDTWRKLGFWSADTGKQLRPLRELSVGIGAVAVAPNGKTVALGTTDGTIRLWETATDNERGVLKGHDDDVRALAFSPDGTQLVSAGNDQTVRLWDVGSGRELRRFDGHKSWVQSVAFGSDGKTIASGSRDQTARLWDATTGTELRRFASADNPIWAVALAPDGSLLATGGDDTIVRIWNTRTGKQVRELKGHTARVWTLAFSTDGRLLASGSEDKTVRLWETMSGQALPPLTEHGSGVLTAVFSPRQRLLATGSEAGHVLLWDLSGRNGSKAGPLASVDLQRLWTTLGSNDVGRALRDMARLADAPKESLPFLQEHLQPVPHVDEAHIARLIADLDSGKFAVRQKAAKELETLAESAEACLRKALADKPSLELQNRLNDLLKPLETLLPPPERLRSLRAIQVLEEIGGSDARHLLEDVSRGEPAAQVTREAKAALLRSKGSAGAP